MRDHSVEQRLKSWISIPFMIKIVSFNAGWVALDGVFGEYMGSITQKELYKYIQENPTQKEAKKKIRSFAAKFQKAIQDTQKACAKDNQDSKY